MQRDLPAIIKYSADRKYRYEIYIRKDGLYQVFVQQHFYDDNKWLGKTSYYCNDIDGAHITDTLDRAKEIGDAALMIYQ